MNKPVAWMVAEMVFTIEESAIEIAKAYDDDVIPLYTHPAELTDEEIDSVVHELRQKSFDPERWLDVYIVAIETIIQLRDELAILRKASE